eukprot:jgi/Mesvir1/27153/Mv20818-RA.1
MDILANTGRLVTWPYMFIFLAVGVALVSSIEAPFDKLNADITAEVWGCADKSKLFKWKDGCEYTGDVFYRGFRQTPPQVAMLPQPWERGHAHGSNVLPLPNGDILAAWHNGFAYTPGTPIMVAKLRANSTRWSDAVIVSSQFERKVAPPVMFVAQMDTEGMYQVILMHTTKEGGVLTQGTSDYRRSVSYDFGETWTPVSIEGINRKGLTFGNPPVQSSKSGDWLLPVTLMPGLDIKNKDELYTMLMRSTDNGMTFSPIENSVKLSTIGNKFIQPTTVEVTKGYLVTFFRSLLGDWIFRSESHDDGATWTTPQRTLIPNSNSPIQAIRLKSGGIALAFNNHKGDDGPRWPLSVALSYDGGLTWPHVRDVERGGVDDCDRLPPVEEERRGIGPEYSSPGIAQSDDGFIHMTYTFRKYNIKYVKLTEDWLRHGTSSTGIFRGRPIPPGQQEDCWTYDDVLSPTYHTLKKPAQQMTWEQVRHLKRAPRPVHVAERRMEKKMVRVGLLPANKEVVTVNIHGPHAALPEPESAGAAFAAAVAAKQVAKAARKPTPAEIAAAQARKFFEEQKRHHGRRRP